MGLFSRDPDDDDDTDDGRSPFEGRGFILSAIVVGAVLVCGIALFVLTRGGDDPQADPTIQPTASQTSGPPVQPTEPPATPGETEPTSTPTKGLGRRSAIQACKLKATDEGRTGAPAGVSWDFQNGILVPVRDTLGPSITDDDGLKRCYHHSPAGAVLALMNTIGQAQDKRLQVAVADRRLAPGPGREAAIDEARRQLVSPTPDDDRYTNGQLQYVGYKILDYTSERALIGLSIQIKPETVGAQTLVVRWLDGDWKMELAPDGQLGPEPDLLASLDGYIRFRGS